MENRFGFKDLIPVVLLVVLIAVAVLGLFSAKRQANEIQDISAQMEKMQGEVHRLRTQLETLGGQLDAMDALEDDVPASPTPTQD